MHNSVTKYLNLTDAEIAFLQIIEQQMNIVADLSRADILLYGQKSREEIVILAHARPHSLAHVYSKSREGRIVSVTHRPEVVQALISGKHQKEHRSFISEGAPVIRRAHKDNFWQTKSISTSLVKVIPISPFSSSIDLIMEKSAFMKNCQI